jgi:muramoyltetrapeptide carboxypeptidase
LRRRGLVPVLGLDNLVPTGYLAGSDTQRAEAFNKMVLHPDVDVLLCVRGGYGSLRILDTVDYDAASVHPKVLVGYSDITALQMALFARSGWKSISGPMVAVDWADPDPRTEELFWIVARGGTGPVETPDGEAMTPLRVGSAEGTLLGGNLSVLTSLIGTPYMPNLEGVILFVEDVDEPPYRVDGWLARLKLSGALERLGGLVFGSFSGCEPRADRPTLSYDDVFRHYAACVPGPVSSGLVYGHIRRKSTLPIGVRARLTVTDSGSSLDVLESVFHAIPS